MLRIVYGVQTYNLVVQLLLLSEFHRRGVGNKRVFLCDTPPTPAPHYIHTSIFCLQNARGKITTQLSACGVLDRTKIFRFDRWRRDEMTSKSHGHPVAGPTPNDCLSGQYHCLPLSLMSNVPGIFLFFVGAVPSHPLRCIGHSHQCT